MQLVSMTAEIRTDEFYDPDNGDTHRKTQWQIFDDLSDTCVQDYSDYAETSLNGKSLGRRKSKRKFGKIVTFFLIEGG